MEIYHHKENHDPNSERVARRIMHDNPEAMFQNEIRIARHRVYYETVEALANKTFKKGHWKANTLDNSCALVDLLVWEHGLSR